MRRGPIVLGAVVATMAAAPAASAATPFTAGLGRAASLAVGADGSGHVVWTTDGDNARVGYCRVSAGAESCNRTDVLSFGTATGALAAARPVVSTPAPNKVVIAGTCSLCPGGGGSPTYVWTSTNNGASFGAPRVLTVFSGGTPISRGLWLDDAGIFVGTGPRVGASNTPAAPTVGIDYAPGGSFIFDPDIVRVPGTDGLIAVANDLRAIRYAVYTGAAAVGAINTSSNWLIGRALVAAEPDSEATALNAGPGGVFLSYETRVAGVTQVGLRRFDATAREFGEPRYLEGDDSIDRQTLGLPSSHQDPAGRIHVVWRVLFDGNRLRYRVSDPGAGSFTAAANLALREGFVDPKLAAGADGRGFAVWQGSADSVRVVPLDPQPEPEPAPAAARSTPAAEPPDADRDGVPDSRDNCPARANRDQADADADTIGDACEVLPAGNVPPVAGVNMILRLVSGDVVVKLPSRSSFVPLKGVASLPVGTSIDARKGVVAIQAAANGFPAGSPRAGSRPRRCGPASSDPPSASPGQGRRDRSRRADGAPRERPRRVHRLTASQARRPQPHAGRQGPLPSGRWRQHDDRPQRDVLHHRSLRRDTDARRQRQRDGQAQGAREERARQGGKAVPRAGAAVRGEEARAG